MSFVFNGKTYDIPGSYGLLEVIQNAGANIPDFQVGLIVGRSIKGIPYSQALPAGDKTGSQIMRAYDNGTDLLRDYGDDNIFNAYKYMSKHGGGMVFVLNANDNAQLAGADIKVGIDTCLTLSAKAWQGVYANDTLVTVDAANRKLILTPPKNVKRLVEDGDTAKNYIYVNSIDGLKQGTKVYLNSNDVGLTLPIEREIKSIDSVRNTDKKGFKVTFTLALGSALLTMDDSARIFQNDDGSNEVFIWAEDGTVTEKLTGLVDDINLNSNLFTATAGTVLPDATASNKYLQILTPDTLATNSSTDAEAATAADYTDICNNFKDWMKDFENVNKVKIRLIYVDSGDAAVHADFRDLAAEMRTAKSPVCVIAGTPWNVLLDSEEVNNKGLIQKAKAIASDDFVLCGGGADNLPSALSFAPSVLGIKMGNSINHNLTRDQLNFNSVEKDWTDPDITKLLKNGVFVYDKYPTGFRVVRGINTYQDQTHVWNVQDRKTYLQMPRDLADAFFRGLLEGLDNDLVGSDQVTRKKVETYCVKTGNNFKASGLINDFKVLAIKRGEAGWLPEVQIEVDDPTDFFGTRIFVISPSLD